VARTAHRLVLDTNVVLRGLTNLSSPSGRVLAACEQRSAVVVLSRAVLAEYRAVLNDPDILRRFQHLSPHKTEIVLRRLMYVGDLVRGVGRRFEFPRDPKDAKIIQLAIAGEASHIITVDDDLLSLKHGRDRASRQFRLRLPHVEVLQPHEYVER
jgi:putative PIN family toxin of toxin-antitoxin system